MAVADLRGRLFGRWNIIDVAALAVGVVVLLLGYRAFYLFRTPLPVVSSITPGQVFAQETGTVHVTGEDLRPFLRVTLGPFTAPLLVISPTSAEVNVKDLSPGTYDFVLLDEARELVRLPRAITVLPPTPPALTQMEMQAVGAFVFLTTEDAARVHAGMSLDEEGEPERSALEPGRGGPVASVLAVGSPEVSTQRVYVSEELAVTTAVPDKLQVPAIVRLRCFVALSRCKTSGINVGKDALVPLALPVPEGQKFTHPVRHFVFRIDDLRSATAEATFAPGIRPVTMEMHAVGDFINLSREDARGIKAGSRFERPRGTPSRADMDEDVVAANVLTVRPPETGTLKVRVGGGPGGVVTSPVPNTWQVPAITRLRCVVGADQQCRIGDSVVSQGALVEVTVPRADGEQFTRQARSVLFRIERLGPVETPMAFPLPADALVRVKFLAKLEVVGLPKAGDEDVSLPMEGAGSPPYAGSDRAVIVSVDTEPQNISATTQMERVMLQETMATFEATVKLPLLQTPTGWQYQGRPVKVGALFRFEGLTYAMDGWVLAVQVARGTQAAGR